MVGSPSPYPYLTHLGNVQAQSTLQLANLSSINAQYRRNSPNYRAFSQPSSNLSPAQQQLQDYQNTLRSISSPFAAEGLGYQSLQSSTTPPQVNPRIGTLLSKLQAQGYSESSYTGGGSRYVLANISLKQDHLNQRDSISNRAKPRHGTEYRLHYYQDSRQEIILLQDTSNRHTDRSLNETPRGVLNAMQRQQAILGATSPALYRSGMMQASFGYNTDQDLILVRKAGEENYRASNINDTGIGTNSEAKTASSFLQQRLARLAKAQEIQRSVDNATEANNNFVITTPRSQLNREAVRKNSQDVIEFFPGLRQGFGFDGSASNSLSASQVLQDHYRTKYLSRAQLAPEAIARAYRNGGINPALYTNYTELHQSRQHGQNLPTALSEDRETKRYQHLLSDGVLGFSNFETFFSDPQSSIDTAAQFNFDDFQAQDSLIAGSMNLINAPIRLSAPLSPSFNAAPQASRGFNPINNIAGSVLNHLSGLVNMAATHQLAEQKLGLGFSSGYAALLQGNIDVSSSLIQGLTGASSNSSLYTIDAANIGAGNGVDVNWQFGRA